MRSASRIQRSHGRRPVRRETHQPLSSSRPVAEGARTEQGIGAKQRQAPRTIAIAAAALLSISGCVVVERPPSAALPCDPALVGDWLIDGAEWGNARQRRLRIDANCRAYLPRRYQPRQVDLRIYQAGEHRYLGLAYLDAVSLLSSEEDVQEARANTAFNAFPQAVSLLRYRAEAQSLTIHAGDNDAFNDRIHERMPGGDGDHTHTHDLLTGDMAQIRKELIEHPELFERPDTDSIYRFNRITPAKR